MFVKRTWLVRMYSVNKCPELCPPGPAYAIRMHADAAAAATTSSSRLQRLPPRAPEHSNPSRDVTVDYRQSVSMQCTSHNEGIGKLCRAGERWPPLFGLFGAQELRSSLRSP